MNTVSHFDIYASSVHVSQRTFSSPRARILLIEYDPDLAGEVINDLMERGYLVNHAVTGTQGAAESRCHQYDLLIVDLLLPDCDGLSIIRVLRRDGFRAPVLVISALGAVNDCLRGFKIGGDDYVTKPFALPELAARVEAQLRRPAEIRATTLRVGTLELDLVERIGRRSGRRIELSKSEFKVLEYFMRRPDRVVTRDMLLEDVWRHRFLPQTNLVDVHISHLRRKIDAPGEPPLLLNVRGMGFVLRD